MNATLLAGVAVSDITPPLGTAMAGFAARTAPCTGVHDLLTARAVALDDGQGCSIVIAADLVALTVPQCDGIRRGVAEQTGVGVESVLVSVTHTHAGPHVSTDGLGAGADLDYVTRIEQDLVSTAVRAWATRHPARIGHAFAEDRTIAHNRRHAGGVIDPTVTVIRVDDEGGAPLAVLFSYSCHPVVLGPTNLLISADWPGEARRRVEERITGAVAVFLQGCCGDINTGHSAHDSMDPSKAGRRNFTESLRIGHQLGDAVADAAASVRTAAASVAVASAAAALPFKQSPAVDELSRLIGEVNIELGRGVSGDRAVVLRGKRAWLQSLRSQPQRASIDCDVLAHRWGSLTIAAVPGEPFVGIALDIKSGFPERDALVLGYCNGVPGYVPYPAAEYEHGGYEVDEAHYFYAQPNCFTPSAGLSLVDAVTSAIDLLAHETR
jgi:hypothetical protein